MKDLCFLLLQAKNEIEVTKIIEENSTLFSQKNWFPIDGNDNNFGLIEAQGRNPERALIEKITNSIDAVLLKECRKRDIEPTSEAAPKTIRQAIDTHVPSLRSVTWYFNKIQASLDLNPASVDNGHISLSVLH